MIGQIYSTVTGDKEGGKAIDNVIDQGMETGKKIVDDVVNKGKEGVENVVNAGKETVETGTVIVAEFVEGFFNRGGADDDAGSNTPPAASESGRNTDVTENSLSDLEETFANLNQFDLGEVTDLIEQLQEDLLNGDIDQNGIFLLQSLMQQQLQLISTISNVQKQQHDARMAVINNIR